MWLLWRSKSNWIPTLNLPQLTSTGLNLLVESGITRQWCAHCEGQDPTELQPSTCLTGAPPSWGHPIGSSQVRTRLWSSNRVGSSSSTLQICITRLVVERGKPKNSGGVGGPWDFSVNKKYINLGYKNVYDFCLVQVCTIGQFMDGTDIGKMVQQ